MLHPLVRTSIALLAMTSSSCGVMIESARVQSDFRASFDCPEAAVSSTMNGYRVEGCGTTAYYACIDTSPPRSSSGGDAGARSGGGIVAALLVGALVASMESDECALAHVERAPRSPSVVALAQAPRSLPGERAVRSQLPVRGGSIVLYGKPTRAPEHVLVDVHASARLRDGPCEPQIFEDGVRVPILQHRRIDPYTERLLVPRSAIAHTKSSVRFAGEVCGFSFDLDELTRKSVALFDARFGELTGGQATAAR